MARVEEQGARVSVSSKSRAEIEAEAGGPKILALRGTVMAFVQNDGECGHQDETSLEEGDLCLEEVEARFHGAEVVKELDDPSLTHVVIIGEEEKDEEGGMMRDVRKERSRRLREGEKVFHLVSAAWAEESVRENRLVSEGEFAL